MDQAPAPWRPVNADWSRIGDTGFNAWVEAFVEQGVYFAFDEEQRLPRDLPDDLAGVRCVVIDRRRMAELERRDDGRQLAAIRRRGVHIFTPDPGAATDRMHMHALRQITNAGLTTQHPAMLDRLAAMDDQRIATFALDTLAEQVQLLSSASAGWAWGDPAAYHIFWPAHEAAQLLGRPQIMDPCWEMMRVGLDPSKWGGVIACGKRFALKYAEHCGAGAIADRVLREVNAASTQTAGRHWQLDGVYLGLDNAAPADADATDPPPLVRDNAWTWPENSGNMGDTLGYVSKFTGDMRHAEAAVSQVLGSDRWCFEPKRSLWYHVGRPTGPDLRSAPWGRGNGWMLYGVRGLLEDLPDAHPARPALVDMLKRELEGLLRHQTPQGLWYNVIDAAPGESRLDTSSAWMIVNTYARAYWKGWLRDDRIVDLCRRAWRGLKAKTWRGLPTSHCMGTSPMLDRVGYLSRPHSRFFATGLLLPWVEMQRMNASA